MVFYQSELLYLIHHKSIIGDSIWYQGGECEGGCVICKAAMFHGPSNAVC